MKAARRSLLLWIALGTQQVLLSGIPAVASDIPAVAGDVPAVAGDIQLWGRFETAIVNGTGYANPFTDVTLNATFTRPGGGDVPFMGFHDGDGNGGQVGNVWKIRFMPDEPGPWTYTFSWSDGTPGGGGAFNVVESGLSGPIVADGQLPKVWRIVDRREFIPFYIQGPGYLEVDDPRMDGFLDFVQGSLGANGVVEVLRNRVWLDCEDETNCSPSNSIFSIANWSRVDRFLDKLQGRELGVNIMFYSDDGARPQFSGQSAMEQLLFVYTTARIGAYPLITFDSGIDIREYRPESWDDWFVGILHGLDPAWHFVASRHGDGSGVSGCTLCDYDSLGDVHPTFSEILSDMSTARTPIAYTDRWREDFIRGDFDSDSLRNIMWHCAVAGGAGFMVGGQDGSLRLDDYQTDLDNPSQFLAFSQFWHETVASWNTFTVCNGDVTNGYCFGDPGNEYVIYLETGGSTTVALAAASRTFNVEWLNPRTGEFILDTPVAGGAGVDFVAPDSNDWVLHIGGLVPDPTPPTAPSGLAAAVVSDSQIVLSWTAASDPDTGISAYKVLRDDVYVATVLGTETTHSDTGLGELTQYTYEVLALNGGGTEGPRSNTAVATTPADLTPPSIVSVQAAGDPNVMTIVFSEPVESSSAATLENYAIDPIACVCGATLEPDTLSVVLTTSRLSQDIAYTLNVSNVRDQSAAGNAILPNTQAPFQFIVRVSDGLVLLYDIEEGSGTTVHDVSAVGVPLDLELADPSAVVWNDGFLSVISSTVIQSPGAATKLIDAGKASNAITVEAWIKPANTIQSGPARIVTLSANPSVRSFTLGQSGGLYDARLRTTATTDNGIPSVSTGYGALATDLTHVVYTRDPSGEVRIHIDAVQQAAGTVDGTLSNWDDTYRFALANELTLDRAWLGELHLVAVYDRALTPSEVVQNHQAGPDGTGFGSTGGIDLNGDGDIDLADFTIFAGCLAGPGVMNPPAGCDPIDFAGADVDNDCDVDLNDFFFADFTGCRPSVVSRKSLDI